MIELYKSLILDQHRTIQDAMRALNTVPQGIVMITDESQRLIGVITDGDIRRALLQNVHMGTLVTEIMCRNPVVLHTCYKKSQALRMFSTRIKQIPVIDGNGAVVDLLLYSDFSRIHTNRRPQIIRAKAPLRISFAGGGTDMSPYIAAKGGIVISTTINQYCYGTLVKRDDSKIVITSRDYDLTVTADHIDALTQDGRLDLIKSVIRLMQPDTGLDLYFEGSVSPGTGLGGSAATAAVTAGLLNAIKDEKLDDYQLAEIAYQAERIEMGVSGGWQDQYAAVFGGFNYIEFKADDILVHPLRLKTDILNELECSFLLCFTGQTRNSGDIAHRQETSFVAMDDHVVSALDQTKELALKIKNVLLRGDLTLFSRLLRDAWAIKKRFDRQISNSVIDALYEAGMAAGALGGKVLGAGGGGYILFFCPHRIRQDVARSLTAAGGEIMAFNFDFKGLQTWTVRMPEPDEH